MSYKLNDRNNMKSLFMIASIVGITMFTACNSNEDIIETDHKVEVDGNQFTFKTEDFSTDESSTRTSNSIGTSSKTVDLGDGIQAEVNIKQDSPVPHTRATQAISDGHYTIYAVNTSTGTRVTGVNSKLSGTVTNGKFITDPGMKLRLTPGNYTFVCFNNAVTDTGNGLTVNNGNDALIGTSTETISGNDWKVNFIMKRQMSRIRFNIVSYTNEGTGITGTLTSGNTYDNSITYAVDGTTKTTTTNGTLSIAQIVPSSGTVVNDAVTRTYNNATAYNYILPGIPLNDITFTFTGGTIYSKALTGKSLTFSNSLKTLERTGSYTVNIKLSTFLFLFDDGTVGAIGDKGSRKAIAYVVKDKTESEEGTAMAMESPFTGRFNNTYPAVTASENSAQFTEANWLTDIDGYKYTWESNGSKDGTTIKALNPIYEAFNKVKDYTPSFAPVTGINVGHWYIPAMGELYLAFKRFRIADIKQTGWTTDYTYITPYATAAGGNNPQGFILSSTEIIGYNGKIKETGIYTSPNMLIPFWPKSQPVNIWPFVHY